MKNQGGAGFTLIEAVLSLAVVSVGFLGVIYAFQGVSRTSLLSDQTIIASNIARGTLEQIMQKRNSSGYAAALTAINSSNSYDANPVVGYPGYVLDSTALEIDPDDDVGTDDFLDVSPGSGYARVTAQIFWNNGSNQVRFVTLMANYP